MVDQTTLGNHAAHDGAMNTESPPRAVARNTAELMSDVVTLAELQGRLLLIDVESGVWKIIPFVITLTAGVILAICCVPIAMATIALGLIHYGGLLPPVAFAYTLLGGAILSLVLVAAAFWQYKRGMRLLERSQNEWKQNMRWIKNTLQRMGRSGSNGYATAAEAQFRAL